MFVFFFFFFFSSRRRHTRLTCDWSSDVCSSDLLADWLAQRDSQPLVSSVLHRAEVPRAVWQAEPGALPRSYKVIKRIARVALSPDVLDDSATLPPQDLSPAQAIHLASALAVKRDLTAFVSYDGPLLAAARDAGLPVASPGAG